MGTLWLWGIIIVGLSLGKKHIFLFVFFNVNNQCERSFYLKKIEVCVYKFSENEITC